MSVGLRQFFIDPRWVSYRFINPIVWKEKRCTTWGLKKDLLCTSAWQQPSDGTDMMPSLGFKSHFGDRSVCCVHVIFPCLVSQKSVLVKEASGTFKTSIIGRSLLSCGITIVHFLFRRFSHFWQRTCRFTFFVLSLSLAASGMEHHRAQRWN